MKTIFLFSFHIALMHDVHHKEFKNLSQCTISSSRSWRSCSDFKNEQSMCLLSPDLNIRIFHICLAYINPNWYINCMYIKLTTAIADAFKKESVLKAEGNFLYKNSFSIVFGIPLACILECTPSAPIQHWAYRNG